MAMVDVVSGSLYRRTQSLCRGLGSAAAWRHSTCIKWIGWTLAMALPWWQYHKHCLGYYYYYGVCTNLRYLISDIRYPLTKVWTLLAPLTWVRLVTSSTLQSAKWQLIGMSVMCTKLLELSLANWHTPQRCFSISLPDYHELLTLRCQVDLIIWSPTSRKLENAYHGTDGSDRTDFSVSFAADVRSRSCECLLRCTT